MVKILTTSFFLTKQFKILTTARSQFHLSLLEAVYISRKKTDLCRQKQFVFTLQVFRQDQSLLALDRLRFSLLLCNLLKIHFSLLQSALLLTAEWISPYCRVHFSLLHLVFKRSCSPHTKPDRDRN